MPCISEELSISKWKPYLQSARRVARARPLGILILSAWTSLAFAQVPADEFIRQQERERPRQRRPGQGRRQRRYLRPPIEAGIKLALQSGGDTPFEGAVAKAEQIQADVGGNLKVESLQDTSLIINNKEVYACCGATPLFKA